MMKLKYTRFTLYDNLGYLEAVVMYYAKGVPKNDLFEVHELLVSLLEKRIKVHVIVLLNFHEHFCFGYFLPFIDLLLLIQGLNCQLVVYCEMNIIRITLAHHCDIWLNECNVIFFYQMFFSIVSDIWLNCHHLITNSQHYEFGSFQPTSVELKFQLLEFILFVQSFP